MANLSNINNKFLVTTGGNVLIGQTADDGNRLQIDGDAIIKNGTYGKILLRSSSNYLYGDANGVLIAAASDNLRLYTAGTQRLRIDSAGNSTFAGDVLIRGTFNPYASANRANITLNGSAGNIIAFTNNTSGKGYIYHDNTDLKILNAIAGDLIFYTNSTERIRIDSSGKVIINDNTIGDKLLLAGDNAGTARGLMFNCSTTTNQGDTWDIDAQSSTGIIKFSTGSSEKMRIDSSGNVGIGGSPNNFTNQKSLTINGIPGGNSRLDFQINGTNEAEIVANDASLIIAHNDILKFYTANAERLRINSSGASTFTGNILMGNTVTNPASGFADQTGIGLKYSTTVPTIEVSSDSSAMQLGRSSTGGEGQILGLRKAGTIIHNFDTNNVSIGTNATFGGTITATGRLTVNTGGGIAAYFNGNGSNYTQGAITLQSSNESTPEARGQGVFMYNQGTDTTWYTGTTYNNADRFIIGRATNASLNTEAARANNAFVTVLNSGNVGIGTSDPVTKLELKSPTVGSITNDRETTTSAFVINGSNENMSLQFGLGNATLNYGNWIQSGYDNGTPPGSSPLYLNPIGGNVGIGTDLPTQKLDVDGQMTHGGLVLKTGTSVYIDTIQTINKTLSITGATWTNTGIQGTDIAANGSYMIQVYSNAFGATGGAWYTMFWTGVMTWYKDSTNGINASEIYLNFSGHALNSNVLQLRTVQHTVSGSPANLMSLEIKTVNTLTNAPISFRFRRLM